MFCFLNSFVAIVTHLVMFKNYYKICTSMYLHTYIRSSSQKTMPLFMKKFDSKSIPTRPARCDIGCPVICEDLDDFKNISLNLGNKEVRFADGIWIHSTRKTHTDDIIRLNRRIKSLEEENNLCNLKMEIFLDLLAQQTTELNVVKSKDK